MPVAPTPTIMAAPIPMVQASTLKPRTPTIAHNTDAMVSIIETTGIAPVLELSQLLLTITLVLMVSMTIMSLGGIRRVICGNSKTLLYK